MRMSDTAFIVRPPRPANWPERWLQFGPTLPGGKPVAHDPAWAIPHAACASSLARPIHAGEPAALAVVGNHLFPVMIRLARALSPRELDAADVAALMIASIVKQIQRRPDRWATLPCWATHVALRHALRQLNTGEAPVEMRAWTPEDRALIQQSTDNAAPRATDRPAQQLWSRLLARLAPRQRLLLSLTEIEGLNPREVASLTGWPHWLTRFRAGRAQQAFDRVLASLLE